MEWTAVTVIVVLAGLAVTVGAPIIRLNGTITKLTVLVDDLKADVGELAERNSASHTRLWEKHREQDGRIENHERRITVMESSR